MTKQIRRPKIDIPEIKLITLKQLVDNLGIARTTLNVWLRTRDFPRPIVLGPKSMRWKLHDVETWLDKQSATADKIAEMLAAHEIPAAKDTP